MFSRECATSNSAVANLLNLTDGLMADVLQLRIICTFNIDFTKIDSALLRKGRLKASYEFKKLETERANALAKKLGYEQEITSPMVLADVFAL
jgi:ATP-dependent 26S proteasome regulatory subunit